MYGCGRGGGRARVGKGNFLDLRVRKVRAAQGTVLDNVKAEQAGNRDSFGITGPSRRKVQQKDTAL